MVAILARIGNLMKALFYLLSTSLLFTSCTNNSAPKELRGTWISSYGIGHMNNDINAEEFYWTSTWQIYKIDESHLTVHRFKNRMLDIDSSSDRTFEYEYKDGAIVLEGEYGPHRIQIESVNSDSMVLLKDSLGLWKTVFRRLDPQPTIFPPISNQAYQLVGNNFRDTFLIINDDKLVRLQEGKMQDGRQYSWYAKQVESYWFFNVEDQYGEPAFVKSVNADTIHLKLFSYYSQDVFMVPLQKSSLLNYLEGTWQQTGPSNPMLFIPLINSENGFDFKDSLSSLQFKQDSLMLYYGGGIARWPLENRVVNNALFVEDPKSNYQFDIWRIKFISPDEISVSVYPHLGNAINHHEPISFKRTKK
jgi:hypothetical protein